MVTAIELAMAATGLSVLVLIGLTVVWVRNYRQFRTPLVLALAVFGAVLLVENVVALYFFFDSMEMLYAADDQVHRWVAVMRSLQLLALCFLGWATMQ